MRPWGRRAVAGATAALGLACTDVTRAAGGAAPAPAPPATGAPPASTAAGAPRPKRVAVPLGGLHVTQGRMLASSGGRYRVESPKVRAEAPAFRRASAALRFTYLGPTAEQALLASGRERSQLGLKLNARDGCNVLYVMWRLAPTPGVVVQVKENPGASRHAECGNAGYRTVRPSRSRPTPALAPGASHLLEARLDGDALVVEIDGAAVWEGRIDAAAAALRGPIGLRTDNVRCELELLGESDGASGDD